MNVLSLFDGMSCGQLALERADIKVDNYFASEINKYAIKVTQKNYPNTIQLGDVENWKDWKLPKIDLILAGSPCQGFSYAGTGLNFDHPKSKLFFTFLDILKSYNPKYFLLENVPMKKEWENLITELVGVEPIMINSALVSAQNRKRLYWTNIKINGLPEDKKIFLKDVLESNGVLGRCVGRRLDSRGKRKDYDLSIPHKQYFEPRKDRKSNCLTTVKKDNVLCKCVGHANLNTHDVRKRVYSKEGKSPTLTAQTGGYATQKVAISEIEWRYLTPIEYERLQTVPDNYTEGVSNHQRYNMLGNGWTVDVIVHILKGIR